MPGIGKDAERREKMTIRELRAVTKCPIYIERTDMDGDVIRTEYLGATRDWQIASIKIVHAEMHGFVLCVELEEGGTRE